MQHKRYRLRAAALLPLLGKAIGLHSGCTTTEKAPLKQEGTACGFLGLEHLATGTFPFVDTAQGATKITDSQTGQVLAAGVDRQRDGASIDAGFQ